MEYRLVWDKHLKGNTAFCFSISRKFFLEAREINDGEKTGVYWQVVMPLFIDNRDVSFFF